MLNAGGHVRKMIYFVDRSSRCEVTESWRAAMASHLQDSSVTRLLIMAPKRENSIYYICYNY